MSWIPGPLTASLLSLPLLLPASFRPSLPPQKCLILPHLQRPPSVVAGANQKVPPFHLLSHPPSPPLRVCPGRGSLRTQRLHEVVAALPPPLLFPRLFPRPPHTRLPPLPHPPHPPRPHFPPTLAPRQRVEVRTETGRDRETETGTESTGAVRLPLAALAPARLGVQGALAALALIHALAPPLALALALALLPLVHPLAQVTRVAGRLSSSTPTPMPRSCALWMSTQ